MSTLGLVILDVGLVAAVFSFLIGSLIILTERWHRSFSFDSDLDGTQKFHKIPVPRIGGFALSAGILAVIFYSRMTSDTPLEAADSQNYLYLLLAAIPALFAGLLEDLTKVVSVSSRLLATFVSALVACWLLDAPLNRLDIWGLDLVLQFAPVAIILTAISVSGVANSINIIDGFNGLAGSTVIIILSGLSFVAWDSGDVFVARLAIIGIGATLGFLVLNYPTGRLFMGDGGAYLLGFWIAEVAILSIVRNPEVNAWQVLAICSYPIIEVLFSIYRRKYVKKKNVGDPDRLHLHSLVYRRLVYRLVPPSQERPWMRNATVSCVIATCVAPATLLAVFFGDSIPGALAILSLNVFLYMSCYARLVRGRWCFNPAILFGFRKPHRAGAVSGR